MNTKEKPGRIGGFDWQQKRPQVLAVYNGGYSPSGRRLYIGDKPWTVAGPNLLWAAFATHAEAIDYAFKQIGTR